MTRAKRFILGGLVILAALVYLIYGGMQEAIVYFVTPAELKANEGESKGKFLRLGGMVVKGSLQRDPDGLTYRFELTDGSAAIPIYFRGVPPDLFTEGKGAVVEGKIGDRGVFVASAIMAKHSEEYSPHEQGKESAPRSFIPGEEKRKP